MNVPLRLPGHGGGGGSVHLHGGASSAQLRCFPRGRAQRGDQRGVRPCGRRLRGGGLCHGNKASAAPNMHLLLHRNLFAPSYSCQDVTCMFFSGTGGFHEHTGVSWLAWLSLIRQKAPSKCKAVACTPTRLRWPRRRALLLHMLNMSSSDRSKISPYRSKQNLAESHPRPQLTRHRPDSPCPCVPCRCLTAGWWRGTSSPARRITLWPCTSATWITATRDRRGEACAPLRTWPWSSSASTAPAAASPWPSGDTSTPSVSTLVMTTGETVRIHIHGTPM